MADDIKQSNLDLLETISKLVPTHGILLNTFNSLHPGEFIPGLHLIHLMETTPFNVHKVDEPWLSRTVLDANFGLSQFNRHIEADPPLLGPLLFNR